MSIKKIYLDLNNYFIYKRQKIQKKMGTVPIKIYGIKMS
jgi:hypothetical protein